MSKLKPIRIVSGIPSLISLIIILFCPVITFGSWKSYNLFSLIGENGDDEITTAIAISCSAIITLIAIIVTIFGTSKKSKIAAIILNIIGLIPIIFLVTWLTSNNDADLIGVAIYLYIIFNIIAVIVLSISDMILNNKNEK